MKKVSVIVPCRDEGEYIEECLNYMINQDYPKDSLEILIVDGMSEDKTREIVNRYHQKYPFVKLVDNPNKTTPFAMNIGVKSAQGDIVMITGAHSYYEKQYVSKCVRYLEEYKADNVGGVRVAVDKKNDIFTKALVQVITSWFGAGNAYYIIGSKEPREVDTVFGGCYRKEVFEKVGLFNERLTRSQDMDLNLRLKRAGGKTILVPDIKVYYYPKGSRLLEMFRSNFVNGTWAVYPLGIIKSALQLRHYIPFFFVASLLVSGILGIFFWPFLYLFFAILGIYLLTNLFFSIKISIKERNGWFLFLLPIIFSVRHFGYGLGSVYGFLTIWKVKA